MLVIELNRQNYEYDTQALVKAFFPEEQVEVLVPESRDSIGVFIGGNSCNTGYTNRFCRVG